MPIIVIYTDKGEQVWQAPVMGINIARLYCPGNSIGAALARGVVEAVAKAEAMEARSEILTGQVEVDAMNAAKGNVAKYTLAHMARLSASGRTTERFSPGDEKGEGRARSRIMNAAKRLGVKVSTRVEWVGPGPRIVGTVRKEQSE
jgi:hypothetical protein